MEKFPQILWSTEFHIFHEFCGKLNSTEFVESNFLVESTFSEVDEFILSWVKKPRVACMTRVAAALSLRQRCSAFQIVSNSSRLIFSVKGHINEDFQKLWWIRDLPIAIRKKNNMRQLNQFGGIQKWH